jgi:hypothetical protein
MEQHVTSNEAIDTRGRIDARGVVILAATALATMAIGVVAYLLFFVHRVGIIPAIALVIAAGLYTVFGQLYSWHRMGGRQTVLEVKSWIRARRIPSDVPEDFWRSALSLKEWIIVRSRFLLVGAIALAGLSLVRVFTDGAAPLKAMNLATFILWLIVIADIVYRNVHTLPIVRGLASSRVEEAGGPFETVAGAPSSGTERIRRHP